MAGEAAKKITKILCMLLGKERTPRGHLMHSAHACLVPVNYATTNVFRQLAEKKKAARNTRSCDYLHLMLLLPFILSKLFKEEVDKHNSHHCGAPVIDPSDELELIGVTNVFLRWYKLFRQTTPAKTPADIGTLHSLSHRYFTILSIVQIQRLLLLYQIY
jgi:hypothetical protein